MIVGVDPDPANKDMLTAWAKNYWDALHPYSAPGAYVNFMMDEGEDRVRATYGKTTSGWLSQGEVRPRPTCSA